MHCIWMDFFSLKKYQILMSTNEAILEKYFNKKETKLLETDNLLYRNFTWNISRRIYSEIFYTGLSI